MGIGPSFISLMASSVGCMLETGVEFVMVKAIPL